MYSAIRPSFILPVEAGMRRCSHWHIQSAALLPERMSVWVNITKASWFYSWEKVGVYRKSWKPSVFTHSLDQADNWDKCCQNIILLKGDETKNLGARNVSLSFTVSPNHTERFFSSLQSQGACLLCFWPVVSLVAFASFLLGFFFFSRMDIQLLKYNYCVKFTCPVLVFQHKCHLGLFIALVKLGLNIDLVVLPRDTG